MESQPTDGLGAELQEVSGVLRHALAEVCGTEIRQANTAELRRFEEVITVAGEATKQMLDLRRRQKKQKVRAAAPQAVLGESAGDAGELAHRTFVDAAGTAWDAFAVYPSPDSAARVRLPGPYQHGWLSFDSGMERRRLSPIPDAWHTATDDALLRMCAEAEPAARRTTPADHERSA